MSHAQPGSYLKLQETRDLLMKALRPHDKDHMEIDVVFNRDKETIRIRRTDIENVVQDILHWHPHCTLYAQARQRLDIAEKEFAKIGFDWDAYNDVKWRILDLYHPFYKEDMDDLIKLGLTPMSIMDHDNSCRFYYNILVRKQWRSKADKDTSQEDIAKRVANDFRTDPANSFLTNRYLPSVIMWNRAT
jgi:hypothetical protein